MQPDLVFSPNLAGYDGDERKRLKNFQHRCSHGSMTSWTCKKSTNPGDIYLYWFGKPALTLAGIGVADGNVTAEVNDGWDWTDSALSRFCGFEPLVALKNPLTLNDITNDRLLAKWWTGRPFQGRPKSILDKRVRHRLATLILRNNPKQAKIASLLRPWTSPDNNSTRHEEKTAAVHSESEQPQTIVTFRFPRAEVYAAAFSQIREEITEKQRLMLNAHFHAPKRTATAAQLAKSAGYKSWGGANLKYGSLGLRLCEVIGMVPPSGYGLEALASFGSKAPSGLPLTMRSQVARALTTLNLLDPVGIPPRTQNQRFGATASNSIFIEGATTEIVAELAYRDSRLRAAAIQARDSTCEVCEFNFEERYGPIGEGFIEVHHHFPLSKRKGQKRKTTLEDVSVVCSNCHRMLHRHGTEPMSIADLKNIVNSARAQAKRK